MDLGRQAFWYGKRNNIAYYDYGLTMRWYSIDTVVVILWQVRVKEEDFEWVLLVEAGSVGGGCYIICKLTVADSEVSMEQV